MRWKVVSMVDLDTVATRLRATVQALQQPPAARAAPEVPVMKSPVEIAVVAMPVPRSWVFTLQRDAEGRLASVLAEPVM